MSKALDFIKKFQRKIVKISCQSMIIFSICLGCSKEQYHRDGSFEYPQHMVWLRINKNIFLLYILNQRPAYDIFQGPAMALKEEVKNGSITLKDRFSIELQHDLRKGAIRYGNDYYHAKVRKHLELFTRSCPEVIKFFSCSTQLSTKFQLLIKLNYLQITTFLALSLSNVVFTMLINVKMPTSVGILTFMSRINYMFI